MAAALPAQTGRNSLNSHYNPNQPRWFMKDQQVNPYEAVLIHKSLQVMRSVGVPWGTFALTAEPLDRPPKMLAAALASNALRSNGFTLMPIGETRQLAVGLKR